MPPMQVYHRVIVVGHSAMAAAFTRIGDKVQTVSGYSIAEMNEIDIGAICPDDLIINTAAMTDVDSAEARHDEAFRSNALLAGQVALWASAFPATFIHISTDYVFSGFSGPYSVKDGPLPINMYGWSKLLGEHAVLDVHPNAAIVRVGWLWGNEYPMSNPMRIVSRSFNPSSRLETYAHMGTPTLIDCVASSILRFEWRPGIHHLSPDEPPITWAEFCESALNATRPELAPWGVYAVEANKRTYRAKRPARGGLVPTTATCGYSAQISALEVENKRAWSRAGFHPCV